MVDDVFEIQFTNKTLELISGKKLGYSLLDAYCPIATSGCISCMRKRKQTLCSTF